MNKLILALGLSLFASTAAHACKVTFDATKQAQWT